MSHPTASMAYRNPWSGGVSAVVLHGAGPRADAAQDYRGAPVGPRLSPSPPVKTQYSTASQAPPSLSCERIARVRSGPFHRQATSCRQLRCRCLWGRQVCTARPATLSPRALPAPVGRAGSLCRAHRCSLVSHKPGARMPRPPPPGYIRANTPPPTVAGISIGYGVWGRRSPAVSRGAAPGADVDGRFGVSK